jgi:tRNA(Ile)-lysidine synthase
MQLIDRVRRFVRQQQLADAESRVVVALSGGSDSVALAHIVRALGETGELQAVGLAHFNHQLRDAADDDEQFCVRIADALGWPILVDREDIASRARRDRQSIEHAARTARHEFFERARRHFGATVVAVGHTRDDQAETFLLRLVRGAGVRGLAAMHPRNGPIIRPLLECRREALRDYLAGQQIDYIEDESNEDVRILRNRVRAELLPMLRDRFNPRIVDVLADEADLARETWQWLDTSAGELMGSGEPRRVELTSDTQVDAVELDVERLMSAPATVRRFAVWRAMNDVGNGRPISFRHVQAVLPLFESNAASPVDLPGQRAERHGKNVVLTSRRGTKRVRRIEERSNFFELPLSIPGEIPLPLAGCVLLAETSPDTGGIQFEPDPAVARVRRDLCCGQLRVRNRRPGDWFRPVGLGGRKKLQDFFVDRKVARHQRDAVPLVVDETDQIVWVAGHGIDEAFRVTNPGQPVLILRLKLLGGPA